MNSNDTNIPDVSVVLPVYNEADNLHAIIDRLRIAIPGCEIIVVDDDSPDGSGKIAGEAGARVISKTGSRGLASALHDGTVSARGKIVLWMDCDLSMPPEDAPRLIEKIRTGADVAVGSRYVDEGEDRRPFIRRVTSRMINTFAELMLPVKIRDYDSGFVAARKNVMDSVPLATSGWGEYCIEFLCMAGIKGFRIEEVGYIFSDRVYGESKSMRSFISFFSLGLNYIRRIIELRRLCKHI
jgi:dolichol-phosphate mannosyltransferase